MKIKINSKLITKIIIVIFIITIIFFLSQPKTLLKSLSPNEKNKIIIKTSEPFLFGNQTIYIKSSKKGIKNLFNSVKYTTDIANDGKILTKDNIDISWIDNSLVTITLTGEEQNPKKISVIFDHIIHYK